MSERSNAMHFVKRSELLSLIAGIPDGQEKRKFIDMLVSTGQVSQTELAAMMVIDVEQNPRRYVEFFEKETVARILWERFKDHPAYLARALVRLYPDVFYTYGYAFRAVMKLRAELGPVVLPPVVMGKGVIPDPSVYIRELPEFVRDDLQDLMAECAFRDYLYFMSRDQEVALELLDDEIKSAGNEYDRAALARVRDRYVQLQEMTFPKFVTDIGGSPFPSIHVCWWLDAIAGQARVLNIGDTGTHKTAFAVLATQMQGCSKVLVLTPANARKQWASEIERYFRDPVSVACILSSREVEDGCAGKSAYTIIAYSTLIRPGVVELLERSGFDGLVIDEVQYGNHVDGPNPADRALYCERLTRMPGLHQVIALSATPWQNRSEEFGAVASMLKPEVFPSAENFRRARPEDPRFMREIFTDHIVGVELWEVEDLPTVTPRLRDDLFGAELIEMNKDHCAVYEFVRENDEVELTPYQKAERLLRTATDPYLVRNLYCLPGALQEAMLHSEVSTKLLWIMEQAEEAILGGAKVVIGSGLYASGVTRQSHKLGERWIGGLLQERFGKDRVLTVDGTSAILGSGTHESARERIIRQWRSDPDKRVLLISMRACPDSINLSVPALDGVTELFITALSFGWEPWKQFLGRFWRIGAGVPIRYRVPILKGTIDERLLVLLEKKWHAIQLFLAQVPLSDEEMGMLDPKFKTKWFADEHRSSVEQANIICAMVRGKGERNAQAILADTYRSMSNGELFARSFIRAQERTASGHISRVMGAVIGTFEQCGLARPERILDAGCGPLTMARRINAPVYSIDMNPHMIALGKATDPAVGQNARIGFLSALPKEWGALFEWVLMSLVIDWSSRAHVGRKIPERLQILSEAVRVCHPAGRVWIAVQYGSLNETLFKNWVDAFVQQGFSIVDHLTGLIRARQKTGAQHQFHFWSLCFSPDGKQFTARDVTPFKFRFEEKQKVDIRHGGDARNPRVYHPSELYQDFEVIPLTGPTEPLDSAAAAAANKEVNRIVRHNAAHLKGWQFHRAPEHLDWRTVQELYARGLIDIGVKKS